MQHTVSWIKLYMLRGRFLSASPIATQVPQRYIVHTHGLKYILDEGRIQLMQSNTEVSI